MQWPSGMLVRRAGRKSSQSEVNEVRHFVMGGYGNSWHLNPNTNCME